MSEATTPATKRPNPRGATPPEPSKPQAFYDDVKTKFAEARDLRLAYRPEGTQQFTSDLTGALAGYEVDPYAVAAPDRAAISDTVEVLFIGGGFSALLTAARLRERGVESIRIVERGADVGGTWYWNRYPGAACDVSAYDYLPLLDEMGYVPDRYYAGGPEIFAHCQAIARKYDLYDLAVFSTTVMSTTWDAAAKLWRLTTDRGDTLSARFVIVANGTLAKPKLSKIEGMETFAGKSFHTSRWDYDYTGADLSNLADKTVGVIGTGASAVQIVSQLGATAKALYVFQRTPSAVGIRNDFATDPEWKARQQPGWQAARRQRHLRGREPSADLKIDTAPELSRDEKIRKQENTNIEQMMRIHQRIDEVVEDKATAEALKPWYMFMCKRPCFDDAYLPTFNLPNVHLVDTKGKGITRIGPSGPEFEGTTYPLDVLIYATGFEVQKTGIYNEIRGEGGLELNEKYADGMRTLLGVHSHGYPNLFIMGGYQASFQFNLTFMLQTQGDHIAECIKFTRENGHDTLDARPEIEDWWVQEVIAHRGKTTRNQDCTPGYYNFEGEFNRRQDGNYNGGFARYFDHMADVRKDMAKAFQFG